MEKAIRPTYAIFYFNEMNKLRVKPDGGTFSFYLFAVPEENLFSYIEETLTRNEDGAIDLHGGYKCNYTEVLLNYIQSNLPETIITGHGKTTGLCKNKGFIISYCQKNGLDFILENEGKIKIIRKINS